MITIQRATATDISGIMNLYKKVFGIEMSRKYYDYLYFNNNSNRFCSFVAKQDEHVIGHNALIEKPYKINDIDITVGLSSGGMVLPEFSGLFYRIIKANFVESSVNAIIAFPNQNSENFFTKLFGFNTISSNYYQLINAPRKPIEFNCTSDIKRTSEFIEWRIKLNPEKKYETYVSADGEIIVYKFYGNEIDIVYCSVFDEFFFDFITFLHKKHNVPLNIIHWNNTFLSSMGFKLRDSNKFVYKYISISDKMFHCQMIDSDVF